jgi:EAL domain-containing protein (putative c-di-GMP-specific phosphodiesterase class I)
VLSDDGCAAIVRGLIRMAGDLGVHTVAEGVETRDQLAWLQLNGCTYVQGFLISRPLVEAEAVRLLSPSARQEGGGRDVTASQKDARCFENPHC